MNDKKSRNIFVTDNKHQERILLPFYVSCLIITGCIVYFAYLLVYHPVVFNPNAYHQFANVESLEVVKRIMLGVVTVIAFLLFFIIYWANYVANTMLGPYKRIIKELDVVLDGKRKEPLEVRKNDAVFGPLLQRVNVLIQHLPHDFKYPPKSDDD